MGRTLTAYTGLQRWYDRADVHSAHRRRVTLGCLCTTRQQTLSWNFQELQWPSSRRSTTHSYDVLVLVYSHWCLHLRMDVIRGHALGRPRHGRTFRRFRLHLLVQLGQQLPCRLVPASSSVGAGGENIPAIHLGRGLCPLYCADVRQAGQAVGKLVARIHWCSLLRNSVCVLLLRIAHPGPLTLRLLCG